MGSLADLEQELAGYQNDLDLTTDVLLGDPANSDMLEMKAFVQGQIADAKARIAAAKKAQHKSAPPPPPPSDDPPTKYDMSKHPKFRNATPETAAPPPPPSDEARVVFNTGDLVVAKYSADKQWYPASIISRTGSSADPVYTVKFTGYPDRETKRKHEVRAVENKKRKADGPPAASVPPPPASPNPVQSGTVISAAPSIDPTLVQKREPSKVSDGPTRMAPAPKKLKGNKTLEKAKSNWADWQKSGPKKPAVGAKKLGKDSQFRTPDLPNAKVGFTGSGKPMSKDQVRTKWQYGQDEPEAD